MDSKNLSAAPTPEDILVKETIEDILALRQLQISTGTITSRSQSQILRSLEPKALARVARILSAMDGGKQ
jgi:hypothetical protein